MADTPTVREILKTLQAKTVAAKPRTMYMDLIDDAEAALAQLLIKERIDELDKLLAPLDSVFTQSVDELTIVKRMAKLKGQLR